MTVDRRYIIPNLERALQVMEYLSEQPSGMGVSCLAADLSIPKNSVFRILTTLEAGGYVERNEATKVYRLSRKLLQLGYAAVDEAGLVERSLDVLHQLRDATTETAVLGAYTGKGGVVVEQVPAKHVVKVVIDIGARHDYHDAAPGKAYLAYLPEAERDAILANAKLSRRTENTLTTKKALLADLAEGRAKGFFLDREESTEGVCCVAATVRNQRGYPIAAIWVTGPVNRFHADDMERFGPQLASAALEISKRFGFMGDKS